MELGHASLFSFLHRELGLPKGAALLPEDRGGAGPELPRDRGAAPGRSPMSDERHRAREGHHAGERGPRSSRASSTSRSREPNVVAASRSARSRTLRRRDPRETGAGPVAVGRRRPTVRRRPARRGRSHFGRQLSGRGSGGVRCGAVRAAYVPRLDRRSSRSTADARAASSMTVSRRLLDKLAAARDALSHSHPGASEEEILEVGLDLILQRHAKRRGIGAKPRAKARKPASGTSRDTASSPKRSRHVPAEVWRGVWKRDRGCCSWPLEGGGVCGSTYQVELDHIDGFALGAGTTIDECRLLCRVHQDVSARQLYGDDLMNLYTRPKGGRCSEPVAVYDAAGASHTLESTDLGASSNRCAEPRGAEAPLAEAPARRLALRARRHSRELRADRFHSGGAPIARSRARSGVLPADAGAPTATRGGAQGSSGQTADWLPSRPSTPRPSTPRPSTPRRLRRRYAQDDRVGATLRSGRTDGGRRYAQDDVAATAAARSSSAAARPRPRPAARRPSRAGSRAGSGSRCRGGRGR